MGCPSLFHTHPTVVKVVHLGEARGRKNLALISSVQPAVWSPGSYGVQLQTQHAHPRSSWK
eukprot:80904-Pelagomonas_calceolata.AAC.3